MSLMNTLRSAWVIARRDFTATVASRTFLLFLLGPLFPLAVGALFGGLSAQVASDTDKPVVAVLLPPPEFARLMTANKELSSAMRGESVVQLVRFDARPDRDAQVRQLLASSDPAVAAVLTGSLADPALTGSFNKNGGNAAQVQLMINRALSSQAPPELKVTEVAESAGSTASMREVTARLGQSILFLLTLLLAGMLLSQLIEEKSNKVIEVLAAAIQVDSIFLGKLFAMLAVSLVGITVWASAGAGAILLLAPPDALASLPAPAVGWPLFGLLAILYFAMSYLLIGAAFLGIGAQASTVRQVQTLSMPVTMAQVFIFAFASVAASRPDSPLGIAAAVFPLSSPFAMIARAAESGALWLHFIAIAWQLLWVVAILKLAASLFRRSVLKSGGGQGRRRRIRPDRVQAAATAQS